MKLGVLFAYFLLVSVYVGHSKEECKSGRIYQVLTDRDLPTLFAYWQKLVLVKEQKSIRQKS